jgi:hypothetical protein
VDQRAVAPAPGQALDAAKSRPSATSLTVKSNSLRATKSTTGASRRLSSACTATLAPISPTLSDGFSAFSRSATFTSEAKEGVEVCSTARSWSRAIAATSSKPCRCGGASTKREPSTSAAGCASQVGNQKLLISRRAW